MIQSTPSLIKETLNKPLSCSINANDNKQICLGKMNNSKRLLSSIDGLSQKEQSKMVEILVSVFVTLTCVGRGMQLCVFLNVEVMEKINVQLIQEKDLHIKIKMHWQM